METVKSPTLREVRALGTLLRVFLAILCVGFAGGLVSLILNWLFVTVPGWFGTPGQLNLIERVIPIIFSMMIEVSVYAVLTIAVSIGIYWLLSFIERYAFASAVAAHGPEDGDTLSQEAEP